MLKKIITILSVALCVVLMLSAPLTVFAQEGHVLFITSLDGFLRFANNCRLDSYSRGLTVELTTDLDLSEIDFSGVPIFCGTFDGNGNRITGLSITVSGSNVGLFRYLDAGASVMALHVEGTVTPDGSACAVGGIAGTNSGTVDGCTFTGSVIGVDSVGGLVGINTLSGVITDSSSAGTVQGNHFAGGIAGESNGVLRRCENHAQVNTTIEQNDVELEDISIGSITGTESAATVTDIGGICGAGSGVIRECINYGSVGYPQIGYNIGGVAGSSSGYIFDCVNHGNICGRKEIGGIVGQLEPAVSVQYAEDTLQTLQGQVDTLSSIAGSVGAQAQSGASALTGQANNIEKNVEDIQDALAILIPDNETTELPDADTILAAQNTLSSSFAGISESLGSMMSISQSTAGAIVQDLQGLSNQMGQIGQTLGSASENLGGSIADVSDLDTAENMTAKTEGCANLGPVQGDWNVGGIIGAIAFESDMDPESDLQLTGSTSMNFDMEFRAVILSCENKATVTGKKQNIGGIVGWMSLGLAKQCVSDAAVTASGADYAGGIAGLSSGYIRLCSAKGVLQADTYAGGIAGSAATVTDCYAIVHMTGTSEKAGAILGVAAQELAQNNYYLCGNHDPGAIDGVSYAGVAEPMAQEKFFAEDAVPGSFELVRVIFQFADGSTQSISLPYGCAAGASLFPANSVQDGVTGAWKGDIPIGALVFFDTTFTEIYEKHLFTLESNVTGHDGRPVLLVQGDFLPGSEWIVEALEEPGATEAWALSLPASTVPIKLRWLMPQNTGTDTVIIQARSSDGIWQDVTHTLEGSYLVFAPEAEVTAIRMHAVSSDSAPYLIGGCIVTLLSAAIILPAAIKKGKKRK